MNSQNAQLEQSQVSSLISKPFYFNSAFFLVLTCVIVGSGYWIQNHYKE
ncbi:unnamed protein product [Paramecium pentaurelia]|uniref:Uncharacterized protein n=1 Tax=Paramecium pentaurelia TaxID=43138 RepID=A0A8S1V0X6_9CILI|nr:unnamed protein product [Paramecium pentaurelia]